MTCSHKKHRVMLRGKYMTLLDHDPKAELALHSFHPSRMPRCMQLYQTLQSDSYLRGRWPTEIQQFFDEAYRVRRQRSDHATPPTLQQRLEDRRSRFLREIHALKPPPGSPSYLGQTFVVQLPKEVFIAGYHHRLIVDNRAVVFEIGDEVVYLEKLSHHTFGLRRGRLVDGEIHAQS